jgi:hypothetical protein
VIAYAWRDGMSATAIAARMFDRNMWLMAGVAVLTFCAASPHSLLYPKVLKAGLEFTWMYESSPFPDSVDRGPGVYQFGWLMLRQALGTPMYVLCLAGVAWACYRHTRAQRVLLLGMAPYFVLTTFATWVVVRYTLPLLPLLLLLGAALTMSVVRSSWKIRHALTAFVFGAMCWTLTADAALLKIRAGTNVRDVAISWIVENVPKNSTILMLWGYVEDVYFNPMLPEGFQEGSVLLRKNSDVTPLLDGSYEYLILNEFTYKNMERLGARHPLAETYALYRALQSSRYRLIEQFKQPTAFLGVDFGDLFSEMDYTIPNPGIRIYRYERTSDAKSPAKRRVD